jgi:hypothetical protein
MFTSAGFDPPQDTLLWSLLNGLFLGWLGLFERVYLSRELELDELEAAIRELKIEKFPGPDGLPVEFYKQMWYVVGLTYLKMC